MGNDHDKAIEQRNDPSLDAEGRFVSSSARRTWLHASAAALGAGLLAWVKACGNKVPTLGKKSSWSNLPEDSPDTALSGRGPGGGGTRDGVALTDALFTLGSMGYSSFDLSKVPEDPTFIKRKALYGFREDAGTTHCMIVLDIPTAKAGDVIHVFRRAVSTLEGAVVGRLAAVRTVQAHEVNNAIVIDGVSLKGVNTIEIVFQSGQQGACEKRRTTLPTTKEDFVTTYDNEKVIDVQTLYSSGASASSYLQNAAIPYVRLGGGSAFGAGVAAYMQAQAAGTTWSLGLREPKKPPVNSQLVEYTGGDRGTGLGALVATDLFGVALSNPSIFKAAEHVGFILYVKGPAGYFRYFYSAN